MGLFRKKKNNVVKETIVKNTIGQDVHIFDGPDGITKIKKIDSFTRLYTGLEYCPECHCLMTHQIGYWECDICKHSITDEESEFGEGYPTLESTYENDYGEYYGDITYSDDDIPEGCEACGGPWPDCTTSCKLIDD